MQKRSIVTLGLLCVLVPGALAAQADVTGEWAMMFQSDQGASEASMTLAQDGETLTGSITGDQGTIEFEGAIVENALSWILEIDANGQMFAITMEGTVDGDEMTGTADFAGYGGGTWTATRQ